MNKSPSQRLRAVIFLLWQQGKQDVDQDEYYEIVMERIINQLKEKLEG